MAGVDVADVAILFGTPDRGDAAIGERLDIAEKLRRLSVVIQAQLAADFRVPLVAGGVRVDLELGPQCGAVGGEAPTENASSIPVAEIGVPYRDKAARGQRGEFGGLLPTLGGRVQAKLGSDSDSVGVKALTERGPTHHVVAAGQRHDGRPFLGALSGGVHQHCVALA